MKQNYECVRDFFGPIRNKKYNNKYVMFVKITSS